MKKRQIPGMQVAVIQHGKIVRLEGFGLANIEHGIPVTNDTVFQINSVTKAFTGVAIMQLVESGKLHLSASVSRYLDGLPPAWQPITAKQLATHASGLPNIMNNATARLIVDGDPAAAWSLVQTLPMEFSPGERFSYNQTNYLVLGKIIDKLSGQRFAQFIRIASSTSSGCHTRSMETIATLSWEAPQPIRSCVFAQQSRRPQTNFANRMSSFRSFFGPREV